MRAHRDDINTPEAREKALIKLLMAVFDGNETTVRSLLEKPSRSNGTGSLSTLDFARQGRAEFRTVESKFLYSSAYMPLRYILGDYDRFMPHLDYNYVEFMAVERHRDMYNRLLKGAELYTPEGRLECLENLYKARGAQGIDEPSDNFTFDRETLEQEFNTRAISPGATIIRPDQAAQASYVGLMNAICDLFLDPAKQKAEDIAAWHAHCSGHEPEDSPWGCAAE